MIRRRTLRILKRLWNHGQLLIEVVQTPILLSVAAAGNAILLVCTFLFYSAEKGENARVTTFFDALWWSFSTVTTVGFGDIVPATTAGRLVGIVLMIGGVISFVSFTALLVAIVTARAAEDILGIEAREARDLRHIATSLDALGHRLSRLEARLGGEVGAILAHEEFPTSHNHMKIPKERGDD